MEAWVGGGVGWRMRRLCNAVALIETVWGRQMPRYIGAPVLLCL